MITKRMKDARDTFMASQRRVHSPLTLRFYEYRLKMLDPLNDRCVHEVTTDDLILLWAELADREERWVDHPRRETKEGPLSPSTLHGYVRAVRAFFNWCVERCYCDRSPASGLKKPLLPTPDPKHLKPDDLQLILDEAHESPRDYAIVCFLADTGCRACGTANLKVKDLDLEHGRATVREKGRGGYGKARKVFLKPRAVRALQRWLDVRVSDSEYVFCWREGGLKPEGIYRVLQRLAKKAGVENHWNPHAFRHGFARGALLNGADLSTISKLLGHSSVAVTANCYLLWTDDETAEDHLHCSWLPDDEEDVANRHDAEQADGQQEGHEEEDASHA